MAHTHLKGKDCPLEATIETLSARLAEAGFAVEEASWLNPVAHVHSVHIREVDCPLLFTNGKGASRKACLASGLGEFVERLANNYFFADFYLGPELAAAPFVHYPFERWFPIPGDGGIPEGLLDEDLLAVYDPEGELRAEHLVDTNSGAFERGVCALPYVRQRDGTTRWFPVSLIGNLYVSNGMSAGNTPEEAQVQGLAEILERAVKSRVIAEGLALPQVPEAVLDRYPAIREGIRGLEAAGFGVRVCDASLGGRYPVMNVTLLNPADGSVFASFGAHPTFEIALERALTELLQGRGLDQLDGFRPPTFDMAEVADPQNLELHFIDSSGVVAWDFLREEPDHPFADWNLEADNATERDHLVGLLHEEGFDVFIADYTHLGAYACRILVPGLSEIYPVDELVVNNNNEGARVRERILSLPDLGAAQWAALYEELEEGAHNDYQPVHELIGVAPEPDTLWAQMRLGELKALLALALGREEEALGWVEWCLHTGELPEARLPLFRCLQALLEMALAGRAPEDFRPALARLYGVATVARAEAVLNGRELFPGLGRPGPSLEGFERHRALLAAYRKLHEVKEGAALAQ
ncbi:ribosomal protein S12 methylthiotransferase [Thiohalorhabdus denitrificans]|uniref:Ribosomal protein S12 methylthiotransferase accessory factor n=1 Tax=Thiohalorhabdus denitrificans TaxID=381306 RepID=A0A0P9CV77_9GAMM|nr:30S ribosomal protein S12 methylthiotransferase accessory factor YcaO [Thiohalorhabdus denitrificans]KPV40569.1 ribosomal protein S12 methylthiotransferase [Thiohalorhabdus denitrificans]SCY50949.1 ribosomal protein S12 methylthiotransferase accessory factor [Thiohalorhabdus denitrificans]